MPNSQAPRDANQVPTLLAVDDTTGFTRPVLTDADGNVLCVISGGGAGTVTSVSVVSANGFAGTVATATSTPALTLSTTINAPVLAGNGMAIAGATTTGSGSTVVLATSPALTTPNIGAATAASINGLTLTASTGTFTLTNGKTFAVTHGLTLSGTDSTVMTFPSTSASIARTDAANTFTGASTASAWVLTSPTITTKVSPTSDDGAPLGDTTHNFSDLFLASGGVINWANGNVSITHSTNLLTISSPIAAGGTITLAENASIALDPAGSADGKYTGITVTATSGYAQAFGDLVYLDPTDSRWEAVDANAAAGADGDARGMLGMVVSAGTDGNPCIILLNGIIRADAKFPSFTVNNPIYCSETAGVVTQTQVTTTDAVIRIVGAALTADELYFNPDWSYITHV